MDPTQECSKLAIKPQTSLETQCHLKAGLDVRVYWSPQERSAPQEKALAKDSYKYNCTLDRNTAETSH